MKKRIWSALLALCIVLSLLPIGALAAEQTVRVGAGQKAGSALSSRPTTGYGIDVSHHQDVIDWNQVKGNIAFAIIRCGYGDDLTSQDDRQFQRNAAACEELGIPYGIYFYSYAEDDTHMQSEISHALRLLQGRKPTLPVYLDLEESSIAALGNAVILRHARAFCTAVANAGFRPGVYAEEMSQFVAQFTLFGVHIDHRLREAFQERLDIEILMIVGIGPYYIFEIVGDAFLCLLGKGTVELGVMPVPECLFAGQDIIDAVSGHSDSRVIGQEGFIVFDDCLVELRVQ